MSFLFRGDRRRACVGAGLWVSYVCWTGGWGEGKGMYVGGLEGSLQDGDGVVLGCYVVEVLWAAVFSLVSI